MLILDNLAMFFNKFRFSVFEAGDKIVIAAAGESVALGDELAPNAEGYLAAAGEDATMKWQVVKIYTMPDGQKGAKIMRIK